MLAVSHYVMEHTENMSLVVGISDEPNYAAD